MIELNHIKKASSIILIFGITLTAFNIFPLNLLFHFLGQIGWIFVAIHWKDNDLLMINIIATLSILMGAGIYFIS